MFLKLVLLASFATLGLAADAQPCTDSVCAAPNCRCASTNIPGGLSPEQTPQFVMLTFDDAVEQQNWETYNDVFGNRTNPDGCPVQATFFMSHEYTDYSKVHNLWARNHEIALHSVTHTALTDYWKNMTLAEMTAEFGDEKDIVTRFANLPADDLKGMRLPFLQLDGDISFQAASDIGLLYDCSWPTQTYRQPGLWPYTLDYKSMQDCSIGPCPSGPIPGVWVVPMIDWTDQMNYVCSMVDACVNIPDSDPDDLRDWFIDNFNVQYKGNRAPFGFFVHAAYFYANDVRLQAYVKFVDYLQGLDDVFLVGPTKVIEWVKNPVPLGSGSSDCKLVEDTGCTINNCNVMKDEESMYMSVCGQCPEVYPWLGNPNGTQS